MHRMQFAASLSLLALIGCSVGGQSSSPWASRSGQSVDARNAAAVGSAVTFAWSPTSITMTDGGPYGPTALAFTAGDTVVVNYDKPCQYRIDFNLQKGSVKNHVETDLYGFYAYSGKLRPPYHCTVHAELKDAGGHVVARADLAVTVLYPHHHTHGG